MNLPVTQRALNNFYCTSLFMVHRCHSAPIHCSQLTDCDLIILTLEIATLIKEWTFFFFEKWRPNKKIVTFYFFFFCCEFQMWVGKSVESKSTISMRSLVVWIGNVFRIQPNWYTHRLNIRWRALPQFESNQMPMWKLHYK